jgi:peptidoglycan hydrolase-like protein with peptidoglycan-binding domain
MPAEAAMSAADRRQVQTVLHRLGYDPGPVDGLFGPLTRAAIRRFQQSIGAELTGVITADEASLLVSRPAPATKPVTGDRTTP